MTRFERITTPTPFAVRNGAYQSDSGTCWWWLRSPGYSSNHAAIVSNDGSIYDFGIDVAGLVCDGKDAVCPALWINLESEI